MFDSIDFIIENINIYDLQLDILKPKVYQFTKNTQVNKYTENIIDFEYKTVKFNYYFKACSLLIHTNAHRILNKTSVDLQDKKQTKISSGNVDIKITAPVKGKAYALEKVNDEVFASGALGKGIAILPTKGEIIAPEDCTVSVLYPTMQVST